MHIFGAEDFKGSAKVNTNDVKQMQHATNSGVD